MTTRSTRTSTSSDPGGGAADRERRLFDLLRSFESVVVAFSGGVDSAYLAWAATRTLGRSALCVTAESPSYPDHHRQLARQVASACGLFHETVATGELEQDEYRRNPTNRCYFCKRELYTVLSALAAARGYRVIVDGSNADDRGDYRPGRGAAREHGVRSPLDDVGLSKAEIRELSRRAGLPTWDEPASACLSSRIPYLSEVTDAKLRMIERAEASLRAIGFRVCRVRHHDAAVAHVEIGQEDLARAFEPDWRTRIVEAVLAAGYATVTIDPRGYRTGSLNEGLMLRPV